MEDGLEFVLELLLLVVDLEIVDDHILHDGLVVYANLWTGFFHYQQLSLVAV